MESTKEKHATHTPGPWKVSSHQTQIHSERYGLVATLEEFTEKSTTHANARLIAAAPEMFEVLQEILAPCPVKGYQGKYDRRRTYNARKKAREVLAKVEGGEG